MKAIFTQFLSPDDSLFTQGVNTHDSLVLLCPVRTTRLLKDIPNVSTMYQCIQMCALMYQPFAEFILPVVARYFQNFREVRQLT